MIIATVSSSEILDHRWTSFSPSDHLGDVERCEDELQRASYAVKKALQRQARAQQALLSARNRRKTLHESGRLTVITEGDPILVSSDPNANVNFVDVFRKSSQCVFPDGHEPRLSQHYEHGQWWIIDGASGASWSVVDAEGPGTVDGFDFEQIDDGDFD